MFWCLVSGWIQTALTSNEQSPLRPAGPPGAAGDPTLASALTRKSLSPSLRSVNAAGGRLSLIKELLFTTKLCLSQVTSPQALLDCHLPRGRGCDIKQTQICQGHRLEHLLQPDTVAGPASQPASRQTGIPHGSVSVFVCISRILSDAYKHCRTQLTHMWTVHMVLSRLSGAMCVSFSESEPSKHKAGW